VFSVHPVAIFLSLFAAFIVLALMQHRSRRARESFIDDYDFPSGVRQKVHKHYPHLTRGAARPRVRRAARILPPVP